MPSTVSGALRTNTHTHTHKHTNTHTLVHTCGQAERAQTFAPLLIHTQVRRGRHAAGRARRVQGSKGFGAAEAHQF